MCTLNSPGFSLADLFQAELAIVLLGNPVALAGKVFEFIAVHDLHCATGVLGELLPLQNTSCQAHRSGKQEIAMKLIRRNQGPSPQTSSTCPQSVYQNPPKIQALSAFLAVPENHFPGVSNTLEAVEKVIEESGLIGREREMGRIDFRHQG